MLQTEPAWAFWMRMNWEADSHLEISKAYLIVFAFPPPSGGLFIRAIYNGNNCVTASFASLELRNGMNYGQIRVQPFQLLGE